MGTEEVLVGEDLEKIVTIGTNLDLETRVGLIKLLQENGEVFAFSAADMTWVSPSIVCHKLNVMEGWKPVKQKKRSFLSVKKKAIEEQINKLLEAKFIEPYQYPNWLANVVMVEKKRGKWRMCDFTDLNKSCPKDIYPLPRIDQLVDSTGGYEFLSFLIAFSGYHQVYAPIW